LMIRPANVWTEELAPWLWAHPAMTRAWAWWAIIWDMN